MKIFKLIIPIILLISQSTQSAWGFHTKPNIEEYELLGLKDRYNDTKLTVEDIKKAFRKKTLTTHPDKGGKAEDFLQLKDAKDTIINYLESLSGQAKQEPKINQDQKTAEDFVKNNPELTKKITYYFTNLSAAETVYSDDLFKEMIRRTNLTTPFYESGLSQNVQDAVKAIIKQFIENLQHDKKTYQGAQPKQNSQQNKQDMYDWLATKKEGIIKTIETFFKELEEKLS